MEENNRKRTRRIETETLKTGAKLMRLKFGKSVVERYLKEIKYQSKRTQTYYEVALITGLLEKEGKKEERKEGRKEGRKEILGECRHVKANCRRF